MARGVIVAVAKDATIPPMPGFIEGKGLTVYPGLLDGVYGRVDFLRPLRASRRRSTQDGRSARGAEDRPKGSSPWRNAADE